MGRETPKIKRIIKNIILLYLYLNSLNFFAQSKKLEKQELVALNFIQAYNQKDYAKMKDNLFFLGRIIVSKNRLKESFSEISNTWGKFTIIKMTHTQGEKLVTKIASEKDTTETETFVFSFTKRNKIISFVIKNTDFIYPQTIENNGAQISSNEKAIKIDSLVHKKYADGNFNGCILVTDNGNIIYEKCYGYANFENKTLLNDSSIFELASCSKQFTSLAIMILAEQGKLNVLDDIQKYIPEIPYRNITIENLLTHTSGLPDYMSALEKYWDKTKFATNKDIVDILKKYKPKTYFKPGESFEYSNTGYALLSIIIEKVSNKTYAEFLAENIFKPLNMKNSRVYNTRRSQHESINNYAYGYIYSDSLKKYCIPDSLANYKYVVYMDAITGDGTVNSTILDLAKWDKALRENKLVRKSTIDQVNSNYTLKNGQKTDYGYGVFVIDKRNAKNLVHHGGNWPGYNNFILRFLDSNRAFIILTNNEYVSFIKLADKIANILIGVN